MSIYVNSLTTCREDIPPESVLKPSPALGQGDLLTARKSPNSTAARRRRCGGRSRPGFSPYLGLGLADDSCASPVAPTRRIGGPAIFGPNDRLCPSNSQYLISIGNTPCLIRVHYLWYCIPESRRLYPHVHPRPAKSKGIFPDEPNPRKSVHRLCLSIDADVCRSPAPSRSR